MKLVEQNIVSTAAVHVMGGAATELYLTPKGWPQSCSPRGKIVTHSYNYTCAYVPFAMSAVLPFLR